MYKVKCKTTKHFPLLSGKIYNATNAKEGYYKINGNWYSISDFTLISKHKNKRFLKRKRTND